MGTESSPARQSWWGALADGASEDVVGWLALVAAAAPVYLALGIVHLAGLGPLRPRGLGVVIWPAMGVLALAVLTVAWRWLAGRLLEGRRRSLPGPLRQLVLWSLPAVGLVVLGRVLVAGLSGALLSAALTAVFYGLVVAGLRHLAQRES